MTQAISIARAWWRNFWFTLAQKPSKRVSAVAFPLVSSRQRAHVCLQCLLHFVWLPTVYRVWGEPNLSLAGPNLPSSYCESGLWVTATASLPMDCRPTAIDCHHPASLPNAMPAHRDCQPQPRLSSQCPLLVTATSLLRNKWDLTTSSKLLILIHVVSH